MKKTVLLSFLFLLFSTAVVVIFVCPVVAEETIYIRPDGTVEGTDEIQRDGNIYTFTDNIFDSIVVERNNTIVDGAGYTLQGPGSGSGITLSGRSNVTIKNTRIKAFTCGLDLDSSSGNNISGNDIITWIGISLDSSNGNIITANNITKARDGIVLYGPMAGGPTHNVISGNYIANNSRHGIMIHGSSNTVLGNYIANNGNGTHIFSPPWGVASSNNLIYNNSYVNNTRQILIFKGFMVPVSINIWDNGVEGNYWSDYEERYPNATEIDGSGIWDTPYVIDENNQDNYPLVPEFPTLKLILLTLVALTVAIAICKRRLLLAPRYAEELK